MRALSLCQSCKRHVRVTESVCPFCGAAFSPVAEPSGLRPRGRPGGRAALFLAGAAAAPGCAEEQPVPVYGVPIAPDAATPGPEAGTARDASGDAREPMSMPVYGVAVYGVPVDRDGGADARGCVEPEEPMAVPEYGVAIDFLRDAGRDAGSCGDAGAARDAGPARDAEITLPPYGIGIDPDNRRDAATRDGNVLGTPVYGIWSEFDPEPDAEK
jgi:hypothetical protein